MQEETHIHHRSLDPARLEAFSDAVIAIIITITVLELKVPQGSDIKDLAPLLPLAIAYLISFQNIGTYWNNHHHLLRLAKRVSAGVMWANLHLLFWLSLIPFATAWLGENHGGTWPTVVYTGILLMCAVAYTALQQTLFVQNHEDTSLMREFKKQPKGFISVGCYIVALIFAFYVPWVADVFIVAVSLMWFLPDRRIERHIA
jgi:uncharacterized membrane protein